MDDHRVDARLLEEHHVLGEVARLLLVAHGVPAGDEPTDTLVPEVGVVRTDGACQLETNAAAPAAWSRRTVRVTICALSANRPISVG